MVNANDADDAQRGVPESTKGGWARHFGSFAPRARAAGCLVLPVLLNVGLIRLAGVFQKPRRTPSFSLTSEQRGELDFLSDNPTAQGSHEDCDREVSTAQVRSAGSLGDVPLVVVASAGHSQTLARLSSRSRLVQPEGGVTADVVTEAIIDVVKAR